MIKLLKLSFLFNFRRPLSNVSNTSKEISDANNSTDEFSDAEFSDEEKNEHRPTLTEISQVLPINTNS
jgi:hypothetical protein